MRFGLLSGLLMGTCVVALALGCAPQEDPAIGAPGGITGRNPPAPDDPDAAPPATTGGTTGTTPTVACATEADYAKDDDAACAVKFSTDIYPLMTGAWNCTGAACHGPGATTQPLFPANDAKAAFAALAKFNGPNSGSAKRPYINPCSKDPAASYLYANLGGTGAGSAGTKMPLGLAPPAAAELDKVKAWIACGSPDN